MEKERLIRKFIAFFERLLAETDAEKQRAIARELADFSVEVNEEVEHQYEDDPIHEIQKACLFMLF